MNGKIGARLSAVAVGLTMVVGTVMLGAEAAQAQTPPTPPPGSTAGPRNLNSPVARVNTVPIAANGQAAANGIRTTMNLSSVQGNANTRGTQVTGSGLGFNVALSGRYYSLVYDLPSVSPQDAGAVPPFCRKNNDTIPFTSMIIGTWVVDPLGQGTLVQLPSNLTQTQGFPLALARTASVRLDQQFGAPILPEPDPVRFNLQSCGTLFTPAS